MPVRTQSSFARATIASGRISASEKRKLQSAIRDMEKSMQNYNEDVKEAKDKKSKWGWLTKAGKAISTLGAVTANPIIGGIGLLMTGAGSRGEYLTAEGLTDEADKIETDAARQLEKLLFVGDEAAEAGKGASQFKTVQQDAAETFRKGALWEGVINVVGSAVSAGQSGSFDVFGDVSGFLNKPLFEVGELKEGATAMDKVSHQFMKSQAPSIGSLAGGSTPYEQDVYGGYLKEKLPKVFDWETQKSMFAPSNSITGGSLSGSDVMAMPEVGNLTDVSYDSSGLGDTSLLDMTSTEFPLRDHAHTAAGRLDAVESGATTSYPEKRIMSGATDITEFVDEVRLQEQISDIYKETSDTWQGVIDIHQTLKDKYPDFYKEWQAKQMGITGIGTQPLSSIAGTGIQSSNQATIPNWMGAMQRAGTRR